MKYLLVLFLITLSFPGRAQFLRADYKKAAELKHRPLAVVLPDPKTEASNACDSLHMAWYNDHIADAFEKQWSLSDSIVFISSRKAASIIGSKSHEYVFFTAGPAREGQQSSGDVFWYPSFTFMLFLSEDGNKIDAGFVDRGLYSEPLVPDMEQSGQLHRGKYIFKLSLAGMPVSENDLAFVLEQFNRNIREAATEKKNKGGIYASRIPATTTARLKKDTLLVPADLDPEGVDEKTIVTHCGSAVKLASHKEIESAISTRSPHKAYIHYLWSDHERTFVGIVVETETLEVIAAFKPGQLKLEKSDCPPAGTSYRTLARANIKSLRSLR